MLFEIPALPVQTVFPVLSNSIGRRQGSPVGNKYEGSQIITIIDYNYYSKSFPFLYGPLARTRPEPLKLLFGALDTSID
jgi:hypothetical protein